MYFLYRDNHNKFVDTEKISKVIDTFDIKIFFIYFIIAIKFQFWDSVINRQLLKK